MANKDGTNVLRTLIICCSILQTVVMFLTVPGQIHENHALDATAQVGSFSLQTDGNQLLVSETEQILVFTHNK